MAPHESKNFEKFIILENKTLSINLRLLSLKKQQNNNNHLNQQQLFPSFLHVRNEIIVDDYFQIEPNICCIGKGDWPKRREIFTRVDGGQLERKKICLYKQGCRSVNIKDENEQTNLVDFPTMYSITCKESLLEITNFILDLKKPQEVPTTYQEYIVTTTVLRQVFRHRDNPNITLYIGNMSLQAGQQFYVYGKLMILDGVKQEIIDAFSDLNSCESIFIPGFSPVIQKLHEEEIEMLDQIKDHSPLQHYALHSPSITREPFLIGQVDPLLLNHFKLLSSQE